MPTGVYFDLPAAAGTAQATGPKVFGYDSDVQAEFFTQNFMQNATDYVPLPWNTTSIEDGVTFYLVEESAPEDVGGGMVQWRRLYYQLPPERSEYENSVYNYTVVYLFDTDTSGWVGFPESASFPLQVAQRVDYKFYATDDPEADIPTNKGWKIFKIGNVICTQGTDPVSGTPPTLTVTSPYLGEDSEVTRWKGNIWMRKQRWVPYPQVNLVAVI